MEGREVIGGRSYVWRWGINEAWESAIRRARVTGEYECQCQSVSHLMGLCVGLCQPLGGRGGTELAWIRKRDGGKMFLFADYVCLSDCQIGGSWECAM